MLVELVCSFGGEQITAAVITTVAETVNLAEFCDNDCMTSSVSSDSVRTTAKETLFRAVAVTS